MALIRFAATVGGYTMASRVLGFVRDVLIAALLGAGPVAEAFVVAFRFPNLFRRLAAEGALAAAFVPLFSRRLESAGRGAAKAFAEQTLAVLLSALLIFTVLVEIAMPWLMYIIAPGFVDEPGKFALAVDLARIAFPYLLFMALAALLGGVLNALYRFVAPAAAPILLNVILIGVLLAFIGTPEAVGHALVWGVAAAGAAQFLMMIVACRRAGMALALPRPRLTPGVRRLGVLMLPLAFTAGALQLNLLIGTMIATLQTGAAAWLYYADRIYQLPLGVVGVAVGTALLPMLARSLRAGDAAAAKASQSRALEVSLLLTLPATAALLVIAWPIVQVLFERGAFSAADTDATARALFAFSLGLPAFVLVKVLSPGFFAREDTVTPFRVTLIVVAINTALSLALFQIIGYVGIAFATSAAAWLHAVVFWIILRRRGALEIDARLAARLPRIVAASAIMAAALWPLATVLEGRFAGSTAEAAAALAALVGAGLVVYGVAAQVLGAARLGELRAMMRRRDDSQAA